MQRWLWWLLSWGLTGGLNRTVCTWALSPSDISNKHTHRNKTHSHAFLHSHEQCFFFFAEWLLDRSPPFLGYCWFLSYFSKWVLSFKTLCLYAIIYPSTRATVVSSTMMNKCFPWSFIISISLCQCPLGCKLLFCSEQQVQCISPSSNIVSATIAPSPPFLKGINTMKVNFSLTFLSVW